MSARDDNHNQENSQDGAQQTVLIESNLESEEKDLLKPETKIETERGPAVEDLPAPPVTPAAKIPRKPMRRNPTRTAGPADPKPAKLLTWTGLRARYTYLASKMGFVFMTGHGPTFSSPTALWDASSLLDNGNGHF